MTMFICEALSVCLVYEKCCINKVALPCLVRRYVCLSINLAMFVCHFVYLSICSSVYLSSLISLSISVSVSVTLANLSVCLAINPYYVSAYLCIYFCLHLSVGISACKGQSTLLNQQCTYCIIFFLLLCSYF